MGQDSGTTGASDVIYDLVSIQYHALKGAQLYDRYVEDARQCGIQEVVAFFEQVRQQDRERALRVHELLGRFSTTKGDQIDLTAGDGAKAAAAVAGRRQVIATGGGN